MAVQPIMSQKEEDASFLDHIKPILQEAEGARLKEYRSFKQYLILSFLLGMSTLVVDYVAILRTRLSDDNKWQVFVFSCLVFYGLAWLLGRPLANYRGAYKKIVIPQVVKILGLRSYYKDGGIDMGGIAATGILPQHDTWASTDHFSGNYKGTDFGFCRVNFQKRQRYRNMTSLKTVFSGVALVIHLPQKKFLGQTVLVEDRGHFFNWISRLPARLKKANLEDPVFEKHYDVYTTDQVEARYILDPVMMERVLGIINIYIAKGLTISYDNGNRVFVLIKAEKEYFNPDSIAHPATDVEPVARIMREVRAMLSLIDCLDMYKPMAATPVSA